MQSQADELLRFWEMLGFRPAAEGRLQAPGCHTLYGHRSGLRGVRLTHAGCKSFGTGHVRLHLWSELRNQGLGRTRPIATGSRWMGMYTRDILQLRDSFTAERSQRDWNPWVTPLVDAPLAQPAPEIHFWKPFVGLRETLVFADDFRFAFIQRAGFDRPGFGTFDDAAPYLNTEGSHANIVQPPRHFDSAFYKQAFGFETAPHGEAHDTGDDAPTIAALDLEPGETFRVERTRAPNCPSGLLQIYSSHRDSRDRRDLSRAGSRGLCLYSVRADDLGELRSRARELGATGITPVAEDEFGAASFCFDAPDGYQWLATSHVA